MGRLECNTRTDTLKTYDCPILIKHRLQTPESKRLNTTSQEIKQLLNNNKSDCIQTFLQDLTPTESTDYSLWKVTKKIKQVKKPSPPLGHHKELRQEAMSKRHKLLLNT
jgi:hypothetical protein